MKKSTAQRPHRTCRKLTCTTPQASPPGSWPWGQGHGRQAEHRSVPDPQKALVATQGLRLFGVPHGPALYRRTSPRGTSWPPPRGLLVTTVTTVAPEICGSAWPSTHEQPGAKDAILGLLDRPPPAHALLLLERLGPARLGLAALLNRTHPRLGPEQADGDPIGTHCERYEREN